MRGGALWMVGRAVVRTALLGVVVLTGLLAPFAQAGIGAVHAAPFGVAAAAGSPGGSLPTQTDPRAQSISINHLPGFVNDRASRTAPATAIGTPMARPAGASVPPGTLILSAPQATTWTSADGRLEVDVPAGNSPCRSARSRPLRDRWRGAAASSRSGRFSSKW